MIGEVPVNIIAKINPDLKIRGWKNSLKCAEI